MWCGPARLARWRPVHQAFLRTDERRAATPKPAPSGLPARLRFTTTNEALDRASSRPTPVLRPSIRTCGVQRRGIGEVGRRSGLGDDHPDPLDAKSNQDQDEANQCTAKTADRDALVLLTQFIHGSVHPRAEFVYFGP